MKIEVDEDMLDGIIVASLTESINMIESEVRRLKKIKNRKEYQERDLEDNLVHLDSLKHTRYYYGGVKYLNK
jgi:hypothetical protein